MSTASNRSLKAAPDSKSDANPDATLIIGAGSKIAQALITRLADSEADHPVVAVSRLANTELSQQSGSNLRWLLSDYSEQSIKDIGALLQQECVNFKRVFICNGVLHGMLDDASDAIEIQPEKRLEDLQLNRMVQLFTANTVIPMLWLKALKPLLATADDVVVTVFSARVGSISDNQKGGWYSYRASKAALNMYLKSAAIELNRVRQRVRILAFHPGTTDTPLSEPFQKAVPKGKLFTPQFVAQQLLAIITSLPAEPAIQFLDWEGKHVDW